MYHDFFVTTTASVFAALVEIVLCHMWANGTLSYQATLGENWPLTLFFAFTITHLRIPHFWLIHRMIHPWKIKGIPDGGKFLYKHVHSLHHKSVNTTVRELSQMTLAIHS